MEKAGPAIGSRFFVPGSTDKGGTKLADLCRAWYLRGFLSGQDRFWDPKSQGFCVRKLSLKARFRLESG